MVRGIDRRRTLPALLAVAALGLTAGTGCQSLKKVQTSTYNSVRALITSSYHDPDAEQKFADGRAMFEKGEFAVAKILFADIADNTQNPALMAEKARYFEAECLRERGKLPEAAATYHRLLQDFPFGAYRERACNQMYAIAYDWLDEGTLQPIEKERNGVQAAWWESVTPGMNVFDKKKPLFDTEGEALRVLDNVQTHDGIGPNADRALFWLGYVHYYRGRFDDADHYFSQLVELHKDSKLREQAIELAILSKQNATGGPVYDSGKASEALQLIHQAEATIPGYSTDPDKKEMIGRQKYAVRMQLATKYLKFGEYYERTNHPASAYFYYDLVCRQHPGTKPAELAKERMVALEPLKAKAEADRAAGIKPTPSWGKRVSNEWDRVVLGVMPADNDDPKPTDPPAGPPPGPWANPQMLPTDIRNPN